MTTQTRRQFLASGSAAAIATVGVFGTSGTATATHTRSKPESVKITFPESTLERYKPWMVTSHLEYEPNALYALHAESEDYDTNMCVYWAVYDVQRGILPFNAGSLLSDSHRGDHEPVYVEYDSVSGDVKGVYYSAYHWLKGVAYPTEELTMDGDHPLMHVVKPWHQTRVTTEVGADVELRDLTAPTSEYDTRFDEWLDAGDMEDVLAVGSVLNPWTMTIDGLPSWWRTDDGWSFNQSFVSTMLSISELPGIDIGGFAKSDPVVAQP